MESLHLLSVTLKSIISKSKNRWKIETSYFRIQNGQYQDYKRQRVYYNRQCHYHNERLVANCIKCPTIAQDLDAWAKCHKIESSKICFNWNNDLYVRQFMIISSSSFETSPSMLSMKFLWRSCQYQKKLFFRTEGGSLQEILHIIEKKEARMS
jgi:hypothetical protein